MALIDLPAAPCAFSRCDALPWTNDHAAASSARAVDTPISAARARSAPTPRAAGASGNDSTLTWAASMAASSSSSSLGASGRWGAQRRSVPSGS